MILGRLPGALTTAQRVGPQVALALTLLAAHLRKPRWVAIKWALVLATILAWDLVMIPRYGNWGAIAGYAVGNAVAVLVGAVLWWRHRPTRQLASA